MKISKIFEPSSSLTLSFILIIIADLIKTYYYLNFSYINVILALSHKSSLWGFDFRRLLEKAHKIRHLQTISF